MTINDPDKYRDAAWDWGILDGCFGRGKIRPSDIDGCVERNRHFLALEGKPPGYKFDSGGQYILCQRLAEEPNKTVLVLWGKDSQPRRMWAFGEMKRPEGDCTLEDVREFVSAWFQMAEKPKTHTVCSRCEKRIPWGEPRALIMRGSTTCGEVCLECMSAAAKP